MPHVVENTIYCIHYPHQTLHNVFLSPFSTDLYTIDKISSALAKNSGFFFMEYSFDHDSSVLGLAPNLKRN